MIVVRVVSGVVDHAARRMWEWLLTFMLAGWGLSLLAERNLFAEIPSAFSVMARLAPESAWGAAMSFVAAVRFAALVLNGTFRRFAVISPKVRWVTTFLSAGAWFALALGILATGRVLPGAITYIGLTIGELWLCWLIAGEAGVAERIHRDARHSRPA